MSIARRDGCNKKNVIDGAFQSIDIRACIAPRVSLSVIKQPAQYSTILIASQEYIFPKGLNNMVELMYFVPVTEIKVIGMREKARKFLSASVGDKSK